jgi:hypothetical protein
MSSVQYKYKYVGQSSLLTCAGKVDRSLVPGPCTALLPNEERGELHSDSGLCLDLATFTLRLKDRGHLLEDRREIHSDSGLSLDLATFTLRLKDRGHLLEDRREIHSDSGLSLDLATFTLRLKNGGHTIRGHRWGNHAATRPVMTSLCLHYLPRQWRTPISWGWGGGGDLVHSDSGRGLTLPP